MPTALLIATARPTFDLDIAREKVEAAAELLLQLGADLHRPPGLVIDAADLDAARLLIEAVPTPDVIIHACATFADASIAVQLYGALDRPVLLWAFREPGHVGDRLHLNSLCGANLLAHGLRQVGVPTHLCYGDPNEERVRHIISDAISGRLPRPPASLVPVRPRADHETATNAIGRMHGQRIGVLGDPPTGFTPSLFDGELIERLFGVEVVPLALDDLFSEIREVGPEERQVELIDATRWQSTVADLEPGVVDTFAAVTLAFRSWCERARLSALAVRCWPEFPTELGVCPCSALSRIADEGTPTQCERDVYGAVTMLLMTALEAGPTYLVDTVDVDEFDNVIRFWHCGAAATSLAADPHDATQDTHCNRGIGVVGNFALRPGPVVLARLTEDEAGGLRLLLAGGTALDRPNRFKGNTADVHLDSDALDFVESLVAGGFPHHTVLAWTDIRPGLRAVADLLGIAVVER